MCDCRTCGAWAPCANPVCANDECQDCRTEAENEQRDEQAAQHPLELLAGTDPRRI